MEAGGSMQAAAGIANTSVPLEEPNCTLVLCAGLGLETDTLLILSFIEVKSTALIKCTS